MLFPQCLILVRGAGDLATGVIIRLHQAGFPVIATEIEQPLVVRRTVSFAQAVYQGEHTVEGVNARRVMSTTAALALSATADIPVLLLPGDETITLLQPEVLVDARLLKRSDASAVNQAALVIGLGPGFEAKRNCHAAIETQRGHDLGRIFWQGATAENTGIPGTILGYSEERLLRAPSSGIFASDHNIGDHVERGQLIGHINGDSDSNPVVAPVSGIVRGLIYPGIDVKSGMKIGDIDPRDDVSATYTISDKSLAIGGAVLTAILSYLNNVQG